jgi:GNAT superfamily N-acetyltransferase
LGIHKDWDSHGVKGNSLVIELQQVCAAMPRPVTAEDEPFLLSLFAECQDQLAMLRNDQAMWLSLVQMQYRGRRMTYEAQYPEASDLLICLDNGTPIGRFLLDRQLDHWRIVDIALLAAHRRQGIGTAVIAACQKKCEELRIPLRLSVANGNPAHRLYLRLGFSAIEREQSKSLDPRSTEVVSGGMPYLQMEWNKQISAGEKQH